MAKVIRFVLGDQLSPSISSLRGADKAIDVVLMAEVTAEASNVKHHKQKIAFVFSAMRHFAVELVSQGFAVDYVKLDHKENTQDLGQELLRAIARHKPEAVVLTAPSEWRVAEAVKQWRSLTNCPIHMREDDRFICSSEEFAKWAGDRRQYRMEFFYREMRRKTGLLMEGSEPIGGQWNFDQENRKTLPDHFNAPVRIQFPPDEITREVLAIVDKRFGDHFGDLEPFNWAVTRDEALQALSHFVNHCLAHFGDFQDAMKSGEDTVFHSLLSPYLNFGLLLPYEVCLAAEQAYHQGAAPLNAVEGFIRQIIGWREFVRGIYWHKMPGYADTNHLIATRLLPWFYWSGETDMKCLSECLRNTRQNAYAHHIQRLMVLGNFALLIGVKPTEIEEWFLAVYTDALEWVELPNVHGMVMHADGGLLASKPYAASGAYINRMSNYCATCVYDPDIKSGHKACPFNYLYWNFLIQNEAKLRKNPRMAMPYKNLARMSVERRTEVTKDAEQFLERPKLFDS